MIELGDATLPSLSDGVARPAYARGRVRAGIVHLGVGGFHRAHQAVYLDRLMSEGLAHDWGICGVGVLPADRRMRDALAAQDHLYTVVAKHGDGTVEPRVVGSIVEYLLAPDDPEAVVERMSDPAIRIVSLTVTEGGYNVDSHTRRFDESNAAVRADLAPGARPGTWFGLVTEAIERRRRRGVDPFTVLSCDNLPGNGDTARAALAAFAELRDPGLGAYVREEPGLRFPNSMVDRITPVTTEEDRALVRDTFGIDDRWPVVCEPFTQWVIEDALPPDRPPLERVGAQVVEDVEPYELIKLRMLNAGHMVVAYLGRLCGYRYVDEVCQDPVLVRFLLGYLEREAGPTLRPMPGMDLGDYRRSLLERFGNAGVRDTVARLLVGTSERIGKFLLPVVREQLAAGGEVARSALVAAAWARTCEGVDEHGDPIEVVDARRDRLLRAAGQQRQDTLAFLRDREIFGDLVDDPRFAAAYAAALRSLHARGAAATLRALGEDGTVPEV